MTDRDDEQGGDSFEAQPFQPIVNLVGSKVALGPRSRALLPLYLKWINDFEVARFLASGPRPTTLEAEEAWYERVADDESTVAFTVYERQTLRPIGTSSLHNVNYLHRTAEFGILIGEKDCWGKGYGTEATALVLDYGFNDLGLHNIMLRVAACNERAIRAYQRAGFRAFGRRREAHRLGNRAYDEVYMECVATEFDGSLLRGLASRRGA